MQFGQHVLLSSTQHVYRLFLPFTCNYITIKGHSDWNCLFRGQLEDYNRMVGTIKPLPQTTVIDVTCGLLGKQRLTWELDQQSTQLQQ